MEPIDGLAHLQVSLEEIYNTAVQGFLAQKWWPALLWTSVSYRYMLNVSGLTANSSRSYHAKKLLQLLTFTATILAACNGHHELCQRRYSEVTFIGSHNSAFVGPTPSHNQYVSVTRQLQLGVRFLQAQTHDKAGTIEMCHTYCWELDSGSLAMYLREIGTWMDDHPNEVVTLLLTNGDAIPVREFDVVFESTGLKKHVFHPQRRIMSKTEWPTLGELIDAKTRLVVFMGMSRVSVSSCSFSCMACL